MIQAVPSQPQEPSKKKAPKIRIEAIAPTMIVELWRMVESSIRNGGQEYPDISEENPEVIRSHLFAYLQQRNFMGFVARIGKKPVGFLLGDLRARPYGRPARFLSVQEFWVVPEFRRQGVGKALWTELRNRSQTSQVAHFEIHRQNVPDWISKNPTMGVKLMVIGGRI